MTVVLGSPSSPAIRRWEYPASERSTTLGAVPLFTRSRKRSCSNSADDAIRLAISFPYGRVKRWASGVSSRFEALYVFTDVKGAAASCFSLQRWVVTPMVSTNHRDRLLRGVFSKDLERR